MHTVWLRGAVACGVLWLSVGDARTAGARAGAPAAQRAESLVATEPIRCWRRTGKSAVYFGERFSLTLTCSVVDTPALRVVAEHSRLDPAALQLPPFDVVEGTRHADIQAGQRRLFQYEYSLRVIAEDLFGREVAIPALDVSYRVQSQVETSATVESMEQTYRLPSLPVRVMALVSPQAVDIRDASGESFDDIQHRRFRGNIAFAVAALLFSASLGSLVVAATAVARRYRTPADRTTRLSEVGLLRSAITELERVREDARREGWNTEAIGRALAALRLGIAIALGRRPPQTVLDAGAPGREGAVIVRSGVIRPKRVMVWASITDDALHAAVAASGGDAVERAAPPILDDFRPILAVLTAARYQRQEDAPRENLDEAVARAVGLLQRLRAERSWPKSAWQAIHRAAAATWPRVP